MTLIVTSFTDKELDDLKNDYEIDGHSTIECNENKCVCRYADIMRLIQEIKRLRAASR